jgi:hypothetical protein
MVVQTYRCATDAGFAHARVPHPSLYGCRQSHEQRADLFARSSIAQSQTYSCLCNSGSSSCCFHRFTRTEYERIHTPGAGE